MVQDDHPAGRRAAVVPNGPGPLLGAALQAVRCADLVIAADGGARRLVAAGLRPHILVGDLDSVPADMVARLAAGGCKVRRFPQAKDETDTELALETAIGRGAMRVEIVAATGGPRLDHSLANVLLLAAPWPEGIRVRLVEATTVAEVVRGGQQLTIEGKVGNLVTLLPLAGPARGITTHGLEYALVGGELAFGRARGVSNVLTAPTASITLEDGVLLVIHQLTAEDAARCGDSATL